MAEAVAAAARPHAPALPPQVRVYVCVCVCFVSVRLCVFLYAQGVLDVHC